ncbi:unnamed protein product [Rotaria sp. Silwood1]|nr:unnamed protein product [Rotaria sp. Silwood1]CAF0862602.1 unnamed protein product [Rotaria sp. Silwood1]CAF3380811.1 unnamed protein product [Rotaria sp. Silwood1]CAF3383298.1 unnamed protein product [Rotaria sp. Silwood1]CAF4806275.1 unnamed protein product [Rotaria sp. Silwood1]
MMKKLDYVNLPGIVNDQPDCFETPDYPVNEQFHEVGHDHSDAVNQFDINAKEVHDSLNGKYLNGKVADFSDSSIKARGYVQHGIYQNYAEHETETPIERYKRLMAELQELEEEFNRASKEGLSKEESENLSTLIQHIQQLQEHTSKVYGAKFLLSGRDTSSLLTKLAASKQEAKQTNAGQKNSDTFKLYINPATVASSSTSTFQLSEIEQKISKLENLVGLNEQQPIESKSLLSSLEQLTTRINLLDGTNVDHIDMKLANVLSRLNAINDKKTLVDEQDKQSKAVELFDMMSRWESMAASLPIIQQRLIALNELYQQAFQFSTALSHYEAEQQALKTSLDANDHLLKQLKTTFESNLVSLQSQLNNIDQKLVTSGNLKKK